MGVAYDHPLRRLFSDLVWQYFFVDLQPQDPHVAHDLSALPTHFTHVDSLYHIRNARGKPLEDIAAVAGAIDLRRPED